MSILDRPIASVIFACAIGILGALLLVHWIAS